MIGIWLYLLAAPSVFDSLIRAILVSASRGSEAVRPSQHVTRWVVLIPARQEGRLVEATLASVVAAGGNHQVETLLVLDGEDPVASELAERIGVTVLVKRPAGPTKGALLGWVAVNHRERIEEAAAVLLLDVGSVISASFFDHFEWRPGSEAMQAWLRGAGSGAGEAAAASESLAQGGEDAGRDRLGWNVRLRGTGTALTPMAFFAIASRLKTQVEDLEASLLLAAADARIALAAREAVVIDEKPHLIRDAAVQRSRWLAGKLEVMARHTPAIYALIRKHPLEGVAFVAEMLGRPLALSIPLRIVAGLWLVGDAMPAAGSWRWIFAAVAWGSALTDVILLVRGGLSVRGAASMGIAWGGALGLAPRAFIRWMRARR